MSLSSVFNVFSKRSTNSSAQIPATFRNRVLLLCRDTFNKAGYLEAFWNEMHSKLQYLHGSPVLHSTQALQNSPASDVASFLSECEGDNFLDFVEYIFQLDCFRRVHLENEFVNNINTFFDVDNLPYSLTQLVKTEVSNDENAKAIEEYMNLTDEEKKKAFIHPFAFVKEIKIVSYPQIILKKNQFTHSNIVSPVLELLKRKEFAVANQSFEKALKHFRKKDYEECLTECGSALESTLKSIFKLKKWKYSEDENLRPLMTRAIEHLGLQTFLTDPFILVGTIRNKLSSSHKGTMERQPSSQIAEWTLNSTGTMMIFLFDSAEI